VITRTLKALLRMFVYIVLVSLLLIVIVRVGSELFARSHTASPADVEPAPAAIVFGAGLWRDGSPTPVLEDRVATAVDLYFSGKVKKILMSGDNRFVYYNEPGAMKTYALSLGVPEEDIVQDFAGRRTYDTCYRARAIFGLKDAILVTQSFHLPRALILCSGVGIQATGVSADRRVYTTRSQVYWNLREVPAILISFWEIFVSHPEPVLGNPEPIFTGDIPTMPFAK